MERWSGCVALVTGASVGIGYALAETLASYGLKVIGCARNIEKIQELSSKISSKNSPGLVKAIKCDMSKDDEILAMFSTIKEEFGGVDICINNAGLAHNASLINGDTHLLRNMLDVNVLGLTICTREAVQSMISRNIDGHIIHISSMSGHRVPQGFKASMYSATKFAVRALTEGLRNELQAMNSKIRVSSVSPGLVYTEFTTRAFGDKGKELVETRPVLQSQDVVDAVIYQLSAPKHVMVNDVLMRPVGQLA